MPRGRPPNLDVERLVQILKGMKADKGYVHTNLRTLGKLLGMSGERVRQVMEKAVVAKRIVRSNERKVLVRVL